MLKEGRPELTEPQRVEMWRLWRAGRSMDDIADALELTASERAELAHDLVASLDGTADADASEEWDRELLRRLDEIDTGTATLIDPEEFSRRMRERLKNS